MGRKNRTNSLGMGGVWIAGTKGIKYSPRLWESLKWWGMNDTSSRRQRCVLPVQYRNADTIRRRVVQWRIPRWGACIAASGDKLRAARKWSRSMKEEPPATRIKSRFKDQGSSTITDHVIVPIQRWIRLSIMARNSWHFRTDGRDSS